MNSVSAGESGAHRSLKQLAVAWAAEHALSLAGTEVSLPRSAYRADVAAASAGQLGEDAVTAVFECKAARSDFLRDAAPEEATRRRVRDLAERLAGLNALIGGHRPDLRRGDTLFAEFDCIDLRGQRHETHARITRSLRAAQSALYAGTKFARLARWRAATFLYLVLDRENLAAPHEMPAGWGVLVKSGDSLLSVRPPTRNETSLAERISLLERIAARAR